MVAMLLQGWCAWCCLSVLVLWAVPFAVTSTYVTLRQSVNSVECVLRCARFVAWQHLSGTSASEECELRGHASSWLMLSHLRVWSFHL